MVLPTNIDAAYADSGTDASQSLHQQHHDTIHDAVNAVDGAYADAVASGFVGTKQAWLEQVGTAAAAIAAADVSVADTAGNFTGTDVEAVLAELAAGGGGGGSVATDAIFDAKGDLAVGTGADAASRLATGTDGHVLTADAAEATGLKWAAPTGGGTTEQGSLHAGIDNRTHFETEFGADEGYDEEFDGANIADNTLPSGGSGTWSWLNQGAAVYRQSFGQGRVDWGGGGTDTNLHVVQQTFPGNDAAWTADAHMLAAVGGTTAEYLGSLTLYSSVSGRIIGFNPYYSDTDDRVQWYVNRYTNATTFGAVVSNGGVLYPIRPQTARWYLKIVKNSQTSYNFLVSPDGGCYFTVGSAINVYSELNSQEPTHIGFAVTTSEPAHCGLEWLRLRGVT